MKGLNVKNGRKNNASDIPCSAVYNASLLYKEKKTATSAVDIEAERERIRQEILKEMADKKEDQIDK